MSGERKCTRLTTSSIQDGNTILSNSRMPRSLFHTNSNPQTLTSHTYYEHYHIHPSVPSAMCALWQNHEILLLGLLLREKKTWEIKPPPQPGSSPTFYDIYVQAHTHRPQKPIRQIVMCVRCSFYQIVFSFFFFFIFFFFHIYPGSTFPSRSYPHAMRRFRFTTKKKKRKKNLIVG